jgi:hypothetical protein
VEHVEEALGVLRLLKRRYERTLPVKAVFKSLIDSRICDSSKSVSDCLKQLQRMGKIRSVNTGVDIELLEDVKIEYVQSSLVPGLK